MASNPSSAATTAVHWTQPGLMAQSEAGGQHGVPGDTCGVIVIVDYCAVLGKMPLSSPQVNRLRGEYIAAGIMDAPGLPGMTIQQVAEGFRRQGVAPVNVVPWGAVQLDILHMGLKNIATTHQAYVIETHNAAALPDNQSGVQNHFILVWGIDSARGYFTCNGDTNAALRSGGVVPPVWYTWAQLLAAEPSAYIALPSYTPPPPPPPVIKPTPDIAGALADIQAAAAALSDATKKLQQG